MRRPVVNGPFHHLAQSHTELICGMNLSLLDGALDELDRTGWCAQLQPHEGRCCVRLLRVPQG
jgi:predicted ArsR family transcriptional regulator